jgi:hypothetical protein
MFIRSRSSVCTSMSSSFRERDQSLLQGKQDQGSVALRIESLSGGKSILGICRSHLGLSLVAFRRTEDLASRRHFDNRGLTVRRKDILQAFLALSCNSGL